MRPQPLYIQYNQFKSRGYDYDGESDEMRKRQPKRVMEILGAYDLTKDWAIAAGDLNGNPTRAPCSFTAPIANLWDALAELFPNNAMKRWTYHYDCFQ